METESGKDTLHDTVGIAYQVMSTDLATTTPSTLLTSPLLEDQAAEPISSNDKRKRRRAYEPKGMFIQPYRKKPRMLTSKFLPSNDARREMHEIKCNTASQTWKKISFGCQILLWILTFKPLCGQVGTRKYILPSTHTTTDKPFTN